MRFDILTLFPELVDRILSESILGRAQKAELISVYSHNIRDYSKDKHRRVDDTPYGGGKGMLLAPDPVVDCCEAVIASAGIKNRRVIYLSPQGKPLTQQTAMRLAEYQQLILLCGHYEGIDERALEEVVDEEISIGDYVLTGGELPACVLVDCVARLIPGVLADPICHEEESISSGMLEYPQYTRPAVYRGKPVPEVLIGGNHKEIARWRYKTALTRTKKKRPDLL